MLMSPLLRLLAGLSTILPINKTGRVRGIFSCLKQLLRLSPTNTQLIFLEFQSAEDAAENGEVFDPPYPAVNLVIEMFDYLAVGVIHVILFIARCHYRTGSF